MDPERVVIDTERVIAEVRARPHIWDPAHELYKSREARQLAWGEVTRALVPDWRDLDRADQRDIEKKIQQRWRTARDCFVKTRAHVLSAGGGGGGGAGGGGGGGKDRGYGYYDAMTFLEPTLRLPLKVQKSIAHLEAGAGAGGEGGVRRKRARLDNGSHCRGGIGGGRAEPPARAPAPAPAAAPAALERRLAALLRAHRSPLDEDDDHFFKSLAPLLRTLTTHHKLAFRSRVLALALEVAAAAGAEAAAEGLAGAASAEPSPQPQALPDEDALDTKYRPPSAEHDHDR